MNVVVVIDGREAVPVRAIPLLTNWETMSPDIVARALAWDEDAMYFEGLQAFQFDEGRRAVPATWWENMARRQLKALSHAIKAAQITHETGLQEWRRKSLEVLPAGVFVWKDEFEPMHCMRYGPGGTTLLKNLVQVTEEQHERLVALDFDPFIPDKEMQGLVMEGFGPTAHSKDGASAAFVLGFYGVTLTSKIEHWAAMAEVQPLEAARLLCGEDPFNVQAHADSVEVRMLTRIFEDRARSHPACRDLRDWALVAQQSRADHREGISKAVVYLAENTVTTTQAAPIVESDSTTPSPAPVGTESTDNGEAWKTMAQNRAHEIIKRQRAKDLYPAQADIADEIAKEFRRDGVMGADGKPLAGSYIKRHALSGISSAQGRQHSTAIRRGK